MAVQAGMFRNLSELWSRGGVSSGMARIAVVDVETTGLNPYRHDRIIELAVVVMRADGTVVRELATLVNPERDMGPSRIHGLTARDVLEAPRFGEIAGALAEVLDGCVAVAGHNVRFDLSFLESELERIGYQLPECPSLCTMHLAGGGSLVRTCADYGIAFDGEAHSAVHDARATANLLAVLLRDAPHQMAKILAMPPMTWRAIPKTPVKLLSRDEAHKRQEAAPSYLDKLLAKLQPELPADSNDSAAFAYTALLDRVLEDRHIDDAEGDSLVEVATRWALSGRQVQQIHAGYLTRLAAAALADGVETDVERRDLLQVGHLLGLTAGEIDAALREAPQQLAAGQVAAAGPGPERWPGGLAGKCVCFTGECQCNVNGRAITREMAADLATRHGVVVMESVTKKLDLLVVADPLTQSGKAKKARQYGIPIMHELVFWQALGVKVG